MINIIPLNNLKDHIENQFCDCNPKIIVEDGEEILIHNSYDRRELIEEAEKILNEDNI